MPITHKKVEKLFNYLKTGHTELFSQQVAPDVQWSVMGHHPLRDLS